MNSYSHKPLVKTSSTKSFALVMASAFLFFSFWPLTKGLEPHYYLLIISAGFLITGFSFPQLLTPLNRLWHKIGLLLHKIVNPLIMGILFFVVFTPLSLILRLFNFDMLYLRLDKTKASYWVVRGQKSTSLETQF